jgi:multidrug efflux pump subunit AcrB
LLRAEKAALEVKEELYNQYQTEQIKHVRTTITNHNGTIILTMAGADQRKLPGKDIIDMWRKKVGPIPEASELSFTSTFNKPGPPVNIELSAYDSTKLKAAATALREHISDYPATYNVRDSFQGGKREVQLHLKPNAYDLGLDLQGLAGQVHQAFQGIEVQSLRRNQDEVKVFLRYPQEERSSLWHLENMRVRLSDGTHVPLIAVADVFYGVGPTKIIRHDSKRIITVEAYVDEGIASSATIMRSIKSNFLDKLEYDYPGVRWIPAGSQKVRDELQDSLILGFMVAMLVMYMLMATLFRSYAQPILVMTAIPFGIIGALVGHLLMGEELTLWSAAGMIAVSGVVVNDNMVLIFYINEKREQGESLLNAIKEAGAARFRPIMITSITTFAGLTPLMAETSWEAQFLIPMAISISFGVMFATLVSLLLIPALYLMLEDINRLFHRLKLRMYARGEDGEIRYSDDIGEL